MEDSGAVGGAVGDESVLGEQEFEVEDILRYRKNLDGSEYFLVKWVGFPADQATWEPLEHMNDNCRELIAKARALYAWRRPGGAGLPSAEAQRRAPEPIDVAPKQAAVPHADTQGPAAEGVDDILIDDIDEDPCYVDTASDSKRPAGQDPDTAVGSVSSKRARLQGTPSVATGLPAPSVDPSQAKGVLGGRSGGAAPAASPASPPTMVTSQIPTFTPQSRAGRDEEQLKPPTEIRCICGKADKLVGAAIRRCDFVVCKVCNFALHPACVEGAVGGVSADDFVCPPCRLERVDEFHPPVGAGLLQHSYASSSSTFSLSFNSQVTQWRKQQWAVHLRAVQLSSSELGGPAWPHRVQGKLNGRQCVAIDPPKHLHVRREQCYNLTPLLRPGLNTLELRFFTKPDRARGEPEEAYCVGVVLTRPRSVASIIARIRNRSVETVSSGRSRVERLLKQVAEHEAHQDECKVTGNFGRILKPHCPVSHCPIEEAAIGKGCNHVQVFDLHSYVAVNQRMRSLDKRWTCPVCSLALRPDDVVLDPFAQGILDTLRGDEDLVESIVFNQDCTWSTVSAVKDDKERQGPEEEAAGVSAAELIDLSDSE